MLYNSIPLHFNSNWNDFQSIIVYSNSSSKFDKIKSLRWNIYWNPFLRRRVRWVSLIIKVDFSAKQIIWVLEIALLFQMLRRIKKYEQMHWQKFILAFASFSCGKNFIIFGLNCTSTENLIYFRCKLTVVLQLHSVIWRFLGQWLSCRIKIKFIEKGFLFIYMDAISEIFQLDWCLRFTRKFSGFFSEVEYFNIWSFFSCCLDWQFLQIPINAVNFNDAAQ